MDEQELAEYRDAQRTMIERTYNGILRSGVKTGSTIVFRDDVLVDEYLTVTIGAWGGWLIQVAPMAFNNRLVLTPESAQGVYDYGWCFPKGPVALLATLAWDPQTQGEPLGFIKRIGGPRQPGETALNDPHAQELMELALRVLELATEH